MLFIKQISFVLLLVLIFLNNLQAIAIVKEDKTAAKWTESLKPQDFTLSLEAIQLKGDLEAYKNWLEKDYKKTPNGFGVAIPYGLVLIDLGKLDKAQVVWERAVKDFFNNPTPPIYKAWVDACKGNYLDAKNAWFPIAKERIETGITTLVWFPYHTHTVLGLYLIKDYLPIKDKKEVEDAVFEIAKHYTGKPAIAAILISEDLKNGRLESANVKLTNILDKYPEDPTALTLHGVARLLKGEHQEALKVFNKVDEIYPNSPTNKLMKSRALALSQNPIKKSK